MLNMVFVVKDIHLLDISSKVSKQEKLTTKLVNGILL